MALSGPPCTRRSPCSSPCRPSGPIATGPWRGCLAIALRLPGRVYATAVPVSTASTRARTRALTRPPPRRQDGDGHVPPASGRRGQCRDLGLQQLAQDLDALVDLL